MDAKKLMIIALAVIAAAIANRFLKVDTLTARLLPAGN
jgi:hypothetical protein